jgi:hypothetical protein
MTGLNVVKASDIQIRPRYGTIVRHTTRHQHHCGRNHRKWSTVAACLWRHAGWISGEGPWAVLAHCNEHLTITLHKTLDSAERSKKLIDGGACGGKCSNAHEIVRLADELVKTKQVS